MKRIPTKFNSHFISRHLFRTAFEQKTLNLINSGRCYDWAYYAYRMFPNVILWTTDFHAWVEVDGRFYDSETRNGLAHFSRLGCNKRWTFNDQDPWQEQSPTTMDVEEFKQFWNNIGAGLTYHWDSILEPRLQAALGSKYYSELTPIFGR